MLVLLAACAHLATPPPVEPPPVERSPAAPPQSGSPPAAPSQAARPPAGAVTVLDEPALAVLLTNPGHTPLVVNFWATWCTPCVAEMAVMRDAAAEFPQAQFALVSVDGAYARKDIAPLLRAQGVALPAYQLDAEDLSGALTRQVPAWPDIIPVTLVLEPGGAVRARFDGAVDARALRAALR